MEFIYLGKTNVRQTELKSFMEVAESLQIKGLSTSQKETKEAIESLTENSTKEANSESRDELIPINFHILIINFLELKRTHSLSEHSEEPLEKEPKLEYVTDLTEDDCENSINDETEGMIPEVSMMEPRFDEKFKDIQSGLKITSIVSANHFDFSDKHSKGNDIPTTSSCPNTDVVMYSTTSLLYDDCIFNRNNIVATQQGLKTYW